MNRNLYISFRPYERARVQFKEHIDNVLYKIYISWGSKISAYERMTSNFCKRQQYQTNGMGFIEIMFNISSREEMK